MLTAHNITYIHPSRTPLFSNINIIVNKHHKVALVGNNGSGKSTLLKLLSGQLQPTTGHIKADATIYYVPQHFGQYNQLSIAQALGINTKISALHKILEGDTDEQNFEELDNDWTIEKRCIEALAKWGLSDLHLNQPIETLSGGQKTKVFLAGISIQEAEIVLMDEPTNHLDAVSRELLYEYINSTNNTLLIVSHDRTLLNLLDTTYELDKRGITVYGGNYEFYAEQKHLENDALTNEIKSREKALRKAKDVERASMDRQQKLDARGKKKQEIAGLPTISMNTFRNNAEKSTAKTKNVHKEKVGSITRKLSELRTELPDADKIKIDINNPALHKGKQIVTANKLNFSYQNKQLWNEPLTFQIYSGERIAISGPNGSGKTTLVRLILGNLEPSNGIIERSAIKWLYIDQDYSLIYNNLSVYKQAEHFNSGALQEHDIKIRLNRFLFDKNDWDKPCSALSGGEKMRLTLCALTIGNQAPDAIVLDEPTNNLDIQNIEILISTINSYNGTLLVISHDSSFLKQINIGRTIIV